MSVPLQILIIDDQTADAELIGHTLKEAGLDAEWQRVDTEKEMRAALKKNAAFEIILAAENLSKFSIQRALYVRKELKLDIPFIAVNNVMSDELVALCLEVGHAIGDADQTLIEYVTDLKQRSHEMKLLNEMGEILQTCLSIEEAYKVITQFGPQLFPGDSGALFMLNREYDLVETTAVWGAHPDGYQNFRAEKCWGLRRGHPHLMKSLSTGLQCQHIEEPAPGMYLCIPMMAHGETIGVFHVNRRREQAEIVEEDNANTESWQRLAIAVAGHIGLALANLRLIESLSNQAVRDPLTNLFNRRYMEESLDREVRRAFRARQPLGVIMLDLDNLKEYNDTYGHEAGSALLSTLGNYLKSQIRGEDIACRYGGDEFTLILPGATVDVARQRAKRILAGVEDMPIYLHGEALKSVTMSLGVAVYPDDASSVEELLEAADESLYSAKSSGKNQCVVWRDLQKAKEKVPAE